MIISNKEMEDIMRIVKSLQESDLLMKGVDEIQKSAFLSMFLSTSCATFLGNLLVDKIVSRAGDRVSYPNCLKDNYIRNKVFNAISFFN